MSEQKNIAIEDVKNKKILKKGAKLSDDELGNVTGGYWETGGYAQGYWIQCPFCGRSNIADFNTWEDHPQEVDQFRCKCGGAFAVDVDGNMYF